MTPWNPAVIVRAPSNIALMKYMGKSDVARNLASNPSLSMTLDGLCTFVEIADGDAKDGSIGWAPSGDESGISPPGKEKFLRHVERFRIQAAPIYEQAGLATRSWNHSLRLASRNTFPHSSGIASSASSFAALTTALFVFFAEDRIRAREVFARDESLREELARLSRQGSGSSCRSFFGPFVEWDGESVHEVPSVLPAMVDLVCLIDTSPKEVGSSEAHRRVRTSPLWPERERTAGEKFAHIREAVVKGDLDSLSRLSLAEALEMHELFHTSAEPFRYITPKTERLLQRIHERFEERVILTLDAGPNLHVLVPEPVKEEVLSFLAEEWPQLRVLADRSGKGPEILKAEG